MINCLGHVGLGVSDIKRSLEFYRDFLGMEVLMELEITDDRIERVIGEKGAQCKIVHLKLGENILELFQYQYPERKNVAFHLRQSDIGITHLGFEVDHFHEHVEALRKRHVEFLGEPVEFRPGVWIVYFRGPDGDVCEFREQPK